MVKKKILFLHNGRMSGLPPFLALLDYLITTGSYDISVISSEFDKEIDEIYEPQGIKFIRYYNQEPRKGIVSKIKNRYKRDYVFSQKAPLDAKKNDYDILWVISEKTAIKIPKFLEGKKYILSSYELNDRYPKFLKKIRPIVNAAKVNVACEYNRSQIMRVWYNLKETPIILPNKPFKHPIEKYIQNKYSIDLKGKKIILFQGHITRDRNLDGICKAVSELPDYTLVLMGDGNEYIDYLKSKFPSTVFIDYVKAPKHLEITSYAHIGIVTYDYYSLNTIYCAPNKIWEYSGFGIPMLANDIPGLQNTVGKNKAGICLDMNDSESIKNTIVSIEENYNDYSKNAKKMYNDCDTSQIIESIIEEYYK